MADEQVIVTRFVGDTSDIDQKLAKSAGAIDQLEASAQKARAGMGDLSGSLGQVAGRVSAVAAATKDMGENAKKNAKEVEVLASGLIKSLAGGEDAYAKMNVAAGDHIKALREITKEVAKTPEGAKALNRSLTAAQKNTVGILEATKVLNKEEAQVVAQAMKLENAIGAATATSEKLKDSTAKVAANLGKTGAGAAKSVGEATERTKGLAGWVSKVGSGISQGWTSGFDKVKGAFGGITDGITKGWEIATGKWRGMLESTANGGSTAFARFGAQALLALGPIGIAITALGAGLSKVFLNTDAGQTHFDGLKRTGSIAFDKLTGTVVGFVDRIRDGNSAVGKLFSGIMDGVALVTWPVRTLLGLIGDLTGISDAIADANKEGQELAQMYDDIDEAQRKNIVRNAELEKQVSALNIKLRNRTLTEKERLDIAEQIAALEQERSENEIKILKDITAAKQKEADNELKNKKEVSDETARALEEAKAAEIRAAQSSAEISDRAAVRADMIRQQELAKNQAALDKKQAADEKAAQIEMERQQKIASARLQTADIARQAELEIRKAEATPHDARVIDLGERYRVEVEKVKGAFKELAVLNEGNAEAIQMINAEMVDALIAIDRRRVIEEEALEKERVKAIGDINAGVSDRALQSAQKRLAGLQAIHEAEIQQARANGEDLQALAEQQQADREALTAQIEAETFAKLNDRHKAEYDAAVQAGADLLALNEQQGRERAELQAQFDAEEKARLEAMNAIRAEQAQFQMNLATGTADFLKAAAGENATAQAIALGIEKAAAIANIIVKMQEAIAVATAQAAANPLLAPLVAARIGLLKGTAAMSIATILAQTIGQLQGHYEGTPYVEGRPDLPGSRDTFVRRLHKGERVVTAKDNAENWEMLEAMREGTISEWLAAQLPSYGEILALNFAPRVNAYVASGEGQQAAMAVAFPGGFDRRIVRAQKEATEVQRENNRLLRAAIKGQRPPSISRRYR